MYSSPPSASASGARGKYTGGRSAPGSFRRLLTLFLDAFRTKANIVRRGGGNARDDRKIPQPLERPLPDADQQRNPRIFRQPSVSFRMIDVMQHIHHVRAADALGIVHARVRV